MKKNFTLQLRKLSLTLFLSLLTYGAFSADLIPYPVYYPITDAPEFNYGSVASVTRDGMAAHMYWHSAASWTATANCTSIAYKTLPSNSLIAAPYGHQAALAIGVNRATYMHFISPYLNPGTYRIYLGVSFSSGTARTFYVLNPKLDSVLLVAPTDTTKRQFFSVTTATAPNKQSVLFTGTGTVKHYDIYCGKATITRAGTHMLSLETGGGTGTEYGFSLLQFIPVTTTDLDADYDYPKFDQSGQAFMSATDTIKKVNNTPTSGYYLPYQVPDPSATTKYDVTFDAGLYFANMMVTVKRAEDKWTRVFVDTADATGKTDIAKLPAGKYFVEVNKGQYSTTVEITGNATPYVGVQTGTVNFSYSPEAWYVGKTLKVYDYTGKILLKTLVIPESGILPAFALPVDVVNKYIYYILNTDGTTHFEDGTISVTTTADINLDFRAAKQNVNIALGNDKFGQNQAFTIVRSTNANALYVSSTSDASGNIATQLPAGSYSLATKSGMLLKTFVVKTTATAVDISQRYTINFCPGKTVANANINVYLSSSKALLNTVTVGSDGKVSLPGMTSGRYYHNMYTANGTDTSYIVKKFTFVVEGADLTLGDATNLEQPYYLPYKVYFDIASGQPELTWRTGVGSFTSGQLKNVKFDNVPIDTIFVVKDTTWSTDHTTYTLNYDSTKISTIKYYDWAINYGFDGLTVNSTVASTFVWGDKFYFRIAPKHPLTFVTPNLNPGRYNVYMSNRWKPAGTATSYCATIDTSYMDGKPLLVTDGLVRSFDGYGNSALLRQFQTTNSAQPAMHLGEALVTKPGTHEFSLYSIVGSTGATANQGNTVWGGMIYFVPIDQDSVGINVTYYPRVDYAGRAVYRNASEGNTTAITDLGTDGINKPKYFPQFADPSILSNGTVDYSKKFTVNGGIYSKNDVLTTVSPIDNWTTKAATADTLGTAVVALNPKSEAYAWAMDKEGVHGTAVVNDNKTIDIPTSIETVLKSGYSITPNIDDETIGTYSFSSTVTIKNTLPFYYPISGVVFYTKNSDIIKAAGDTLYKPKLEALNGISPVFSTDLPILPYTLSSIYTGNGTRLQAANGMVTSVKTLNTVVGGIYPNPARETMNLKLAENAGVATFAIYNQLGQIVRRGSFTGTESSVSLNGVNRGMYIVKVGVNGKNWNTKLIVE